MGKFVKNNLANFLVIVIIAVLVGGGTFYYLSISTRGAETQQVKIVPTNYQGTWQNPEAALMQDLDPDAGFEKFNEENSTFPFIPEPEEIITSPSEEIEEIIASPSESLPLLFDLIATESEELVATESEPIFEEIIEIIATESEPLEQIATESEESPLDTEDLTGQVATESEEVILPPAPVIERPQGLVEKTLEFSDFGVPQEFIDQDTEIKNVQLRLSMAYQGGTPLDNNYLTGEPSQDNLIIEYEYNSEQHLLAEYFLGDPNSNATNNDYWLYALPIFENWENLGDLKIRFIYRGVGGDIYLDALWLEIEYKSSFVKATEDKELTDEDVELNLVSNKKDFKLSENPEFGFKYKRKKSIFKELSAGLVDLFQEEDDEYKDINIQVIVLSQDEEEIGEIVSQVEYRENGEFLIDLDKTSRAFKPGKYILKIIIEDKGKTFEQEQDFTWGVLAINTNKSIYLPNEQAYLQMAVLDDEGHTICNANLRLQIRPPAGEAGNPNSEIRNLSTEDGGIEYSGECGPDNVVDVPDYFAYYQVGDPGIYEMRLFNLDNKYEINDSFEVRDWVPFDIERIGPTRIYPPAVYSVKLIIKANQNFQGEIREYVPLGFKIITPVATGRVIKEDKLEIIWRNRNWKIGEIYELEYQFDAPDISPYLYLLGPLEFYEQK